MSDKFEAMLKKTVNPSKCREVLVGSDYLSDVTFTLGPTEDELKAHKFFLMTASPVFHSLFTQNSEADGLPFDLKIAAISKPIMTEICRFAYADTLNLNADNMLEILLAASKFQMKFLVEKTIGYICDAGMNEHSVFRILDTNQKENNMRINMKCFEFIQKNHQKCFNTDDFKMISLDLLRAIMQTCKIPKVAAKGAIALWSANPDNADEDLDELIALVSLNEDVEEVKDGSDTESVSSHVSSRAGSNAGNRQKNRKPRIENFRQQNQQDNRGPRQPFNQNQKPLMPHNPRNQGPPRNSPNQDQNNNNQAQNDFRKQQEMLRLSQSRTGLNSMRSLMLAGNNSRRNFKFANLNLNTQEKAINIHEIHFIYDLSTTDRDFQMRIIDQTGTKCDLFFCQVYTNEKTNGEFSRYVLPRPCFVPSKRHIWISIEFSKNEHRLSRDNTSVFGDSCKDRLVFRREIGQTQSGQIISSIIFSDAPNET